MRWPARRRLWIGLGAALIVLVAAGVLIAVMLVRSDPAPAAADGQVPAAAVAAATDAVSGTDERARAALSPVLSGRLSSASAIAPAGSTLLLDPDSWGQNGAYASAIGQLTVPGQAARPVFVGFVLVRDGWRVTAVEAMP